MTLAPDLLPWAAVLDQLDELQDASHRARDAASPGELARILDPATVQTPALDVIDANLVDAAEGRCDRLMFAMPPQEGKSVRISRRFPQWLLMRNPELRIAIVSYAMGVARRHGRFIRDDIAGHPELGHAIDPNVSAANDWELKDHQGGVYSVGINGSLTSRPVDVLIIDDPYKNGEQADSEAWTETVRDFWTEIAVPRLGPGAIVIIVQTRWRDDDLSGWLQAEDKAAGGNRWRVVNIPAQADHDPARGETDILGRQPGEYMISARGRTVEQWEERQKEVGSRSWNALFQGRPAPAQGNIFQRSWWQEYDQPQWVVRDDGVHLAVGFDELLASWDMAFKATDGTDYVCGQIWGRRGVEAYLLDEVHDRLTFVETCAKVRALAAKWPQATLKLVEDKANGPAVLSALRQKVGGLVPEEPNGSKVARAAAVSPFVEAGNVFLPAAEIAPWVDALIEEAQTFPRGRHDDRVDAMSQALNRLLLMPLLFDEDEVEDEETANADDSISPY